MHLLVIPNEHLGSVKTLNRSSLPLIQEMLRIGQKLHADRHPSSDPVMGFHMPPFTSVEHLHLHVLGGAFKNPFRRLKYQPGWKRAPWWITGHDFLEKLKESKE